MALPDPVPGLVICYAYLWRDEARRGLEDGRKDRPCVIVLSVQTKDGKTVVTVAPVTHALPRHAGFAVEIPAATRRSLGLDNERSWIVTADLNRFIWPGMDLRPIARGAQSFVFGHLPTSLYRNVRESVLALARAGRAALTPRSE